jgi:hypothetical protein
MTSFTRRYQDIPYIFFCEIAREREGQIAFERGRDGLENGGRAESARAIRGGGP